MLFTWETKKFLLRNLLPIIYLISLSAMHSIPVWCFWSLLEISYILVIFDERLSHSLLYSSFHGRGVFVAIALGVVLKGC